MDPTGRWKFHGFERCFSNGCKAWKLNFVEATSSPFRFQGKVSFRFGFGFQGPVFFGENHGLGLPGLFSWNLQITEGWLRGLLNVFCELERRWRVVLLPASSFVTRSMKASIRGLTNATPTRRTNRFFFSHPQISFRIRHQVSFPLFFGGVEFEVNYFDWVFNLMVGN